MRSDNGLISLQSSFTVPETLDRLEVLLPEKQIIIFGRVDHAREAQLAGLKMPPTQLLIFGSPRIGTPIMLTAPVAAIDSR